MISKRNYLIIILIMAIMFVLFQYSQVYKDTGNEYNFNQYSELKNPKNNVWKQQALNINDKEFANYNDKYILVLVQKDSAVDSIVSQWTFYSKQNIVYCDSVLDYSVNINNTPEMMIIDSNCVDFEKCASQLIAISDSGVNLVFCNLPDPSIINESEELKDLFGIKYIKDEKFTVDGYKLFGNFLLGGETIYRAEEKDDEDRQDLNLELPWYVLSGGSKTYMVGLTDYFGEEYEHKNEYYPAAIWRHGRTNAQVFCVNGDYMSDTVGLGIMSAMGYELSNYQLYPVVNAQNTLVIDYPLMTNENDEVMNQLYSRSVDSIQTTIVWPSLVSLAEKNGLKYTCFMTPKYNLNDSEEPSYDTYDNLLQLFGERGTEVGMSLDHNDKVAITDKVKFDANYYDGIDNKYMFTSAFLSIDDIKKLSALVNEPYVRNVRTIACDQDVYTPILSYVNEDITLQSLTSNTKNFTYSKDLSLKSIETVLGYDNAKLNLSDVYWPDDKDDQWENIYDDMSSSLTTYWTPFRVFERTTLTESDNRVRTFLNIHSKSVREGNCITLKIDGLEGEHCWFILRTHDEAIESINNASYQKIEEDAYLIETSSNEVNITLKSTVIIK